MKILVASDKFKGSLTASEACEAIAEGLRESCGGAHSIRCLPVADGGDGIAETLLSALGGTWHETKVTGPLGNSVRAGYAMIDDDRTAVIEMAKASGLVLVGDESKDPWRATTRGTGELILHAIESGAREILLGIGGSATNDGGTGMAEALGYRFEDADGRALAGLPLGLDGLARIVPPGNADFPKVTVACDVSNPLLGRNGCTRIYGP
ncbi:MAG TPA: glycerate kinase, partial [Bacteroidia bacterium]|nr:glycerate kinase [Bacteroidia bacterium]